VFAQLERETIAERIKDNYHQRAKRGAYLGGPAPFGFDIQRTVIGGKAASMLVPNDNIEIVRQIFNKYAYTDMSLGKIAAWLVEQNIPGIGRKTWDSVSISRILHNPSYVKADADIYYYYRSKGLVLYNEIDEYTDQKALWLWGKRDRGVAKYTNLNEQLLALAHHDGIIDSATFLACQHKLDSNKQIKNTGKGKYTWLSGLIKCSSCGYSLKVINTHGYHYFSCSGRTNLHLCDVKHTERVEDVEAEAAQRIQSEIDRLSIAEAPQTQIDTHNAEKIEIEKISQQISNLMDRLEEANDITMRYINERIVELDTRRAELLDIVNATQARPALNFPDCPFEDLDFDSKRGIAQLLVKRVDVSPDGVSVFFK
jgi:site-specific DNA recombinase